MRNSYPLRALLLLALCLSALSATPQQGTKLVAKPSPTPALERQFQAAAAQYDAGHFAEAAAQLEQLLPQAPTSFQVHELLGLTYAAESSNLKALEHLQTAVQLDPSSAVARTNLAASLAEAGHADQAREQFQKAIQLDPQNFDANHNLAELNLQSGKLPDALPLLERAQKINPTSYDNGYDLALAWSLTGKLAQARQLVQSLIRQHDTGELHNLLGQIEEKDAKYIEAEHQFEVAAHMDPSEENLFAWGSELLLHRTYDPAVQVFQQATLRFPGAARLMIGLGMALDLRGSYDDAVKALLKAADLAPTDPGCYLFLSKAYDSSKREEEVIARFRRYAELEPNNGLAQYYYAMSLWKGKRTESTELDRNEVEALLQKSIALDAKLAEAHLQLGNLYSDRHLYDKSIPYYQRALELNPNLPDAHYRLGQDYVHLGQKDQAQKEFAVYRTLRAQRLADLDSEKSVVQQFVYTAKATPASKTEHP